MRRREFLKAGLAGMGAAAVSPWQLFAQAAQRSGMNVLFLGVDDLRCNLGCYGDTTAVTPHIDRLASRGTVFKRAYVQQAVCSASRASMLTGCRPDTTTVDYPYNEHFTKQFLPAHPSLPRYFANQGFTTRSGGKIHHGTPHDLRDLPYEQNWWYRDWHYNESGERVDVGDYRQLVPDKAKWRQARAQGITSDYVAHAAIRARRDDSRSTKPPAYECLDVVDTDYRDGRLAASVMDALRSHAQDAKPFFYAAGFVKPHLPFNAPKKYWDLYQRDQFTLPGNRFLADNVTGLAPASYEMPAYEGGQVDFHDEERLRLLTHGYYACTSFTDANIGKVLNELDRQKLTDRTIVILWSDHGFHLGENQSFGKHTCFEVATRSPLIIATPDHRGGQVTDALTEYVDIFPTMCDLTDVAKPDYLAGSSLVPQLEDPTRPGKDAAFSQWPRGKTVEGYSIRTDRYRYTEWRQNKGDKWNGGEVLARELYDHQTDPGESVNLADQNAETVARLSAKLRQSLAG